MGVLTLQKLNKSIWFSNFQLYKQYLYEDSFIRKYIFSFLSKWSRGFTVVKILGSLYIRRTFGKIYLSLVFFYPFRKKDLGLKVQKKSAGRVNNSSKAKNYGSLKPLRKCKKSLLAVVVLYQLEYMLNSQIFFKYTNICISPKAACFHYLDQFIFYLQSKLSAFRSQFSSTLWLGTITFLANLFMLKQVDIFLFANYIANVFLTLRAQTRFLLFLKHTLTCVRKLFWFKGIRLVIAGKLNN